MSVYLVGSGPVRPLSTPPGEQWHRSNPGARGGSHPGCGHSAQLVPRSAEVSLQGMARGHPLPCWPPLLLPAAWGGLWEWIPGWVSATCPGANFSSRLLCVAVGQLDRPADLADDGYDPWVRCTSSLVCGWARSPGSPWVMGGQGLPQLGAGRGVPGRVSSTEGQQCPLPPPPKVSSTSPSVVWALEGKQQLTPRACSLFPAHPPCVLPLSCSPPARARSSLEGGICG